MIYGHLTETVLITAKIGKAIDYHYCMPKQAKALIKWLIEHGYETETDL